MQEYQSYKGKYIGPGCYSSRAEVDEALKREAVENVQMLAELFIVHKNYATAAAQKYCREFGGLYYQVFNVTARYTAAAYLAEVAKERALELLEEM